MICWRGLRGSLACKPNAPHLKAKKQPRSLKQLHRLPVHKRKSSSRESNYQGADFKISVIAMCRCETRSNYEKNNTCRYHSVGSLILFRGSVSCRRSIAIDATSNHRARARHLPLAKWHRRCRCLCSVARARLRLGTRLCWRRIVEQCGMADLVARSLVKVGSCKARTAVGAFNPNSSWTGGWQRPEGGFDRYKPARLARKRSARRLQQSF